MAECKNNFTSIKGVSEALKRGANTPYDIVVDQIILDNGFSKDRIPGLYLNVDALSLELDNLLNKRDDLDQPIYEFDKVEILKLLKETLSNDFTLNPRFNGESLFNFSNSLDTYKTLSLQKYAHSKLYNEIYNAGFINRSASDINDVFVISDESLNRNILSLKNNL